MNLTYIGLVAQVLNNLASVARNSVLTGADPDAPRSTNLDRVGELIETTATIVQHGEQAYEELKAFDATIAQIKASGQPLQDADFDRIKSERDAIHAKADEIRARPLPELLQRPADGVSSDAATLMSRPSAAAAIPTPTPTPKASEPAPPPSTKPAVINPTLPGAREIQKAQR